MGLDQFMYVATKAETSWNDSSRREIGYRRKHPNLQGWMEQLWHRKLAAEGKTPEQSEWGSSFNGIELELTAEDLDELEQAVTHGRLPPTQGFFFGSEADQHYREQDLGFIRQARAELFMGLRVFYNSSW